MLTNVAVKAARPRTAAYKLADQGGLHLYVAPTPRWTWRWRFGHAGKEQLLTLGSWPEMSFDQARTARDLARALLARGEDPRRVRAVEDPKFVLLSISRGGGMRIRRRAGPRFIHGT